MKIKRVFGLVLLSINSLTLSAQTLVSVNKAITRDTLLVTVQANSFNSKTVTASGQTEFTSKSGYVRVLLSNDYGSDLLVYESTPLVATDGIDNFSGKVMESFAVPSSLELTHIRVAVKNAKLNSLSITVSNTAISVTQQEQMRVSRIDLMNRNLRGKMHYG